VRGGRDQKTVPPITKVNAATITPKPVLSIRSSSRSPKRELTRLEDKGDRGDDSVLIVGRSENGRDDDWSMIAIPGDKSPSHQETPANLALRNQANWLFSIDGRGLSAAPRKALVISCGITIVECGQCSCASRPSLRAAQLQVALRQPARTKFE
jgi:hypothetical protein